MNNPGATVAKLLEMCPEQTSQWPKKGDFTIYARVYLDVDDEEGSDDVYIGQTREAARRHMAHNAAANNEEMSRRVGYNANIASRTRSENRHVRILACNKTMGFQHAREYSLDMVEQTAMLALRTYSNLLNDFGRGRMEAMAQQSLFMVAIDEEIREGLGFQKDFRPEARRGINIASPLFGYQEPATSQAEEDEPAEVQSVPMLTLHIDPQHPNETGYMQYKMPQVVTRRTRTRERDDWVLKFNGLRRTATPGASSFERCRWELDVREDLGLEFHRVFGDKQRVTVMVVYELMDEVQPSEYPGPKIGPFRPPHRYPVLGLPKIGPYRDELGLSSLGMRVEWQDPESGLWYSAPVGKTQRLANLILGELSAGNTCLFNNSVQMLTALIQMLLSQRCLDPAPGFLKEIHPASLTPLIQRLELDYLKQTARWVTQTTSIVGPVVPTTDEENKGRLTAFLEGLENSTSAPKPFMTSIGHPGSGGDRPGERNVGAPPFINALFTIDTTSSRSAGSVEDCCDTCQVRKRTRELLTTTLNTRRECDYNDSEKSCTTCKTLGRICTFTALTRLLELWVGEDGLNPRDYQEGHIIQFPCDARGPMTELMVRSAFMVGKKVVFSVIQEPWNCQLSFLMADEAAANKDKGDAEVVAVGEEEEEDGE